jgi:hypothetical protein
MPGFIQTGSGIQKLTWRTDRMKIAQEAKTGTEGLKFLRSVAGYTWKGQIRNTRIGEELNICNLIKFLNSDCGGNIAF